MINKHYYPTLSSTPIRSAETADQGLGHTSFTTFDHLLQLGVINYKEVTTYSDLKYSFTNYPTTRGAERTNVEIERSNSVHRA